jgi:hypothetical protein
VTFESIITTGDTVAGSTLADGTTPWRFVGIPDGLGAFDNGNGTFTVLVNHELPATNGIVRAHGSKGAFVDKLVIDKTTLTVLSASDLDSKVYLYDTTTSSYSLTTTAFARFCSADLAAPTAFYDATTGLGTTARIYLNGEENGPEGRGFAHIVTGAAAGAAYELPFLGNLSFENLVANPLAGAKTIVAETDDSSPTGQVYFYIGDKKSTGSDIDKAGLTGGKFYGVKVSAFATETDGTTVPADGTAFQLAVLGTNGDVSQMTGAQIDTASIAAGVTGFLRPEDGAWDPSNPSRFYFVTTNGIGHPSRLWALDFTDISKPELGGTVKMLLDGTDGEVMFDNIAVSADGKVIIQEDPGNNVRLAKIWIYDPVTDTASVLAEHDSARFAAQPTTAASFLTQDEESSGVIDVTNILGAPGKQAFLLDVQNHLASSDPALVEGGQLTVMYVDRSLQGTAGADTLTGSSIDDAIFGNQGNDLIDAMGGKNIVDGGSGDDTINLGFKFTDATVSISNSGIVTISGPNGIVDTITNVEHFKFSDGTVDRADGAPLVDDLFYFAKNLDVWAAKIDPDSHYAANGWKEGRDPNTFFSTKGYLGDNADVKAAGVNPLQHYDQYGWKEGRDPSANFDTQLYLKNNPDVAQAGIDPLLHYLQYGQNEGRQTYAAIGRSIVKDFDKDYYLLANSDVAAAGIDPLTHFQTYGWKEGRNPNAYFDTKGYLAKYTDVAKAGVNPLDHYVQYGWKEGRDPSGAFDTKNYLSHNTDVANAAIDPLQHYLQFGALEGRNTYADGLFA